MSEIKHSFVPGVLVTVLTLSILAITAMLFFEPIHNDNKDILLIIIGVLLSRFSDAISYYIGTSHASVSKNKALDKDRGIRITDKPEECPHGAKQPNK